jgi:hypothetical protein
MRRKMLRPLTAILAVCIFSVPLDAQYGTASNGYYPANYNGSIFTGSVESVVADTQEITLVYTKGSKSERFVGRFESACSWKEKDGSLHSVRASDIPKGTVLTALYSKVTKKSGGHKTDEFSIFAISFVEFSGKRIPDDRRLLIYCSDQKYGNFKVF